MKKRILSIMLTIIMVVGVMPMNVQAAAPVRVLALGDSITTGYGLKNAEKESFAALLANDHTVVNKAVNGNTVMGIAAQIQTGAVSMQEIAEADVITITVGGNDMMALLYTKIAEMYNANYGANISAADVNRCFGALDQSKQIQNYFMLDTAKKLLNKDSENYLMDAVAFADALAIYQERLTTIAGLLKQANSDVEVIVSTQYNPYAEFKGNPILHFFYEGIEDGVEQLNASIKKGSEEGLYKVVDIKEAFDSKYINGVDLYNANPNMKELNLDFHPNTEGHAVLAEAFNGLIEEIGSTGTTALDKNVFYDVPADAYYAKAVEWAVKNDIATGTSPMMFGPDETCTRGQVMTFLWRLAGTPVVNSRGISFIDVPAGSYYYDAVLWGIENGLTSGVSDTVFGADAACTRGQVLTFLWRLKGCPEEDGKSLFKDVEENSYYKKAILWAVEEKIACGISDTAFEPDAGCTRGQIVTFLWRFAN